MFVENNSNSKSTQSEEFTAPVTIASGATEDVTIDISSSFNFYGYKTKEPDAQIHLITQDIDVNQSLAIFTFYNSGMNEAHVTGIRKRF